jgi:hypothetical protein
MRAIVLAVYMVALLMQLGGAVFVIHDVVRNTASMREFMAEWNRLSTTPGLDWPEFKQQALADHATRTAELGTAWRRWAPVSFLLAGVVLGFLGNAIALFIAAV